MNMYSTDAQLRDAYERGETIESLGGMVAARALWRIYGGDEGEMNLAKEDISEWIACNE
jgi:hypothetical protein